MTCLQISLNPTETAITRYVGENLIISCTLTFSESDTQILDDEVDKWDGITTETGKINGKTAPIKNAQSNSIVSRVRFTKGTGDQTGEYKCSYDDQVKSIKIKFVEKIQFTPFDSPFVLVRGSDSSVVCASSTAGVTYNWRTPDGTVTPGDYKIFNKFT